MRYTYSKINKEQIFAYYFLNSYYSKYVFLTFKKFQFSAVLHLATLQIHLISYGYTVSWSLSLLPFDSDLLGQWGIRKNIDRNLNKACAKRMVLWEWGWLYTKIHGLAPISMQHIMGRAWVHETQLTATNRSPSEHNAVTLIASGAQKCEKESHCCLQPSPLPSLWRLLHLSQSFLHGLLQFPKRNLILLFFPFSFRQQPKWSFINTYSLGA